MKRLLLTATMLGALGIPVIAQDHDRQDDRHENTATRRYYDRAHKDNHEWNESESAAWNVYRPAHHVRQSEFGRVSRRQQQDYWNWRHEHPDNH